MPPQPHAIRDIETPILIVGGGPVGLAIAADLGWRGIRCVLVERSDGSISNPRTIAENVRTMEFCRRWGISRRVQEAGFPPDFPHDVIYVTSLRGYLIGRVTRPTHGSGAPPNPISPERAQRCHQGRFDPILRDLAASFEDVDLIYETAFETFKQDDRGIVSRVCHWPSGNFFNIRSQYLVACCGGRSGIRQQLGIEMEGRSALGYPINIVIRTPELWALHDKGKAAMCNVIGPDGVWATINSVDGRDTWRISLRFKQPTLPEDVDIPAVIRRIVGCDFDYAMVSSVPWVQRALVAERYGEGRVLIAGDCAHQNPPDGGLGMNTGFGDAIDIAWKLTGVIEGWGGGALIRSYESERRPIGQRNVAEALRSMERRRLGNVDAIEEASARGEQVRRSCAEQIARGTSALFRSEGVALGYRYEDSPICCSDGTPAPSDAPDVYFATTRPGHRAPHAWLSGGRSTLDLFGRGFMLMRFGADAPDPSPLVAAAKRRSVPLSIFSVADPAICRLYERKLVLIRPDGHVAWRSDRLPVDPIAIVDRIRGAEPVTKTTSSISN